MDTRIKAIKKVCHYWNMMLLSEQIEGCDSENAILYRARWNAAKEMYEILTGEKWVYYNL